MDKESAEGVAGDMARLWGSQELCELRRENKRLKDERDDARADIEELKRQVEELKRSVENTGGQLPVGSRALCIGENGKEEKLGGASPGPTEVALVRPSSDGIVITQDLPGTVLQFTLPDGRFDKRFTHYLPVPTRRRGKADVVFFGRDGVTILRTSLMPHSPKLVQDFRYNDGWTKEQHVRLVGDTTGNGHSDIIGFGSSGVLVSHNNGDSFSSPSLVLEDFGLATGWRVNQHIRYVTDLRKMGYVDIIGFGTRGVFVSLNNGDGTFAPARLVLNDFGFDAGGWRLNRHLRFLADVTGDGILDIVAFGERCVFVALGNGDGTFAAPRAVINDLACSSQWTIDTHRRTLADLTGDGKADIIGSGTVGVYVALNNGDGTFQAPRLVVQGFSTVSNYPVTVRVYVADVNGSGYGDIVGISDRGIFVAIGNGDGTFQAPEIVNNSINHQVGEPQFFVDLTGDGAADLIYVRWGAVFVSYNDGSGRFGPEQGFFGGLVDEYKFPVKQGVFLMANL
jgi:hypothetical protein